MWKSSLSGIKAALSAVITGCLLLFFFVSHAKNLIVALECFTEHYNNKTFIQTFSSDAGLSYFHNPGSEALHYLTISQLSEKAAQRWPDKEAFISVQNNTRFTFSEVDQHAAKLAAGFLELGLMPGDRIGLCSPNSYEWFLTSVAAAKAGLVLVSMNSSYLSHEIEYCLQKVGIKALVTDESHKKQHYYKMLCDIIPGLAEMPENSSISCDNLPDLSFVIINSKETFPGTHRLCDIQGRTENLYRVQQLQEKLRPENVAIIQFTSGTTGKPKAVPLLHFNLINNSYFFGKRNGFDKKHHKILTQAPYFHVLGYIGSVLPSLIFGTTIVMPSPTFSVADSAEAIMKEKCTMLIGTPTMFIDLCSYIEGLPDKDKHLYMSPELAVSGGALCSPELLRKMKITFSGARQQETLVQSVYGLTETTGAIFQSTAEDSGIQISSTVGRLSEHTEAKVVDGDGLTVPLGMPGELWIRSYTNMEGYWEDQQNTEDILTKDRWLKTGDKFIMMENGYGQVVGRIKEMIIRGGENISPKEIEDFLVTHPSILDAQVYGVSSERLGEEVGCSLRLKPGAQISVQQVKDFCKGKIAYFKIPKYVEFLDEFPKTASGKVQKFKIREAVEKKLELEKEL